MSLQNLETYVVLVSYTLWCFSFYIREAVLLSLETSLLFFALVVEYLCTEAETVTLLRQPYLVTCYSTLLVYLVTCYLFYLSTCLLATCSTWIYMLL